MLVNQQQGMRALRASTPLLRRLFATAPSASEELDVICVGGGPGGYVFGIKAAQLGLKTAVVESRGALGGTCLNVGCIPSKALLNSSHHYHMAQHDFKTHGIVGDFEYDLDQMMKNKEKTVKGLTDGIEKVLFKKYGVLYVPGKGSLADGGKTVQVAGLDGSSTTLKAKNVVIATGSEPTPLPSLTVDNEAGKIVDSTGALSLKKVPKHLVVVGAGVIGLELGSVYARLGAKVTVVEFLERVCAGMDLEVSKAFQSSLRKQGLEFKLGTKVMGVEEKGDVMSLALESAKTAGETSSIDDVDCVLVATGRRAYTEGLNLDGVGVKANERGVIEVDANFQTNVPGVYAIGDCIPGPMLAHKAEEEGVAVAENLSGGHGHVNYNAIPSVIYTHPEFASVGMTEEEVKAKGIPYTKGVFSMQANSRARANGDSGGMIKILTHKETDQLLGGHILASGAGELITTVTTIIEYGGSSEDLGRLCFPHPTLSEGVKESAMAAAFGKPIHM